jgi:hypothetical protein
MTLEECTPGRMVIIGAGPDGWYLARGLSGYECEVLDARPPYPNGNPAYPRGLVQVRLPEECQWECREPWFDPEHLACLS